MQRLRTIFVSFFKIGLFTFGGGYAMLPLIEQELIAKRGWIEHKEFLDLLTLAQSVPGPIAINTSVFVGYKMRGLKGAVAALLGSVLPSFVIILAIALLFADIRHNPVVDARIQRHAPAVVALIVVPVISLAPGDALGHVRGDRRVGAGRMVPGLVADLYPDRSGRHRHRMDIIHR